MSLNANNVNVQFRDLAKLAIDQGWEIDLTGGDHLKWIPPEGEFMITSSTPSDQHIVKTVKRDLEKRGLITDKGKWRRQKRLDARVFSMHQDVYQPSRVQTVFSEATGKVTILTSVEKEALGWLMAFGAVHGHLPTQGQFHAGVGETYQGKSRFPHACTCGTSYLDPIGVAVHCYSPQTHTFKKGHAPLWPASDISEGTPAPVPDQGDDRVDRDPEEHPPDRDRIDCPECGFHVWSTQQHLMDKHLVDEHNLVRCEACSKVMQPTSIDRHRDEYCTVLNPLRPAKKWRRHQTPETADEWSRAAGAPSTVEPVKAKKIIDAELAGEPFLAAVHNINTGSVSMQEAECLQAEGKAVILPPPLPEDTPLDPQTLNSNRDSEGSGPITVPSNELPVVSTRSTVEASGPDLTDDDLFSMLEMILNGPVTVTRESFTLINQWMEATRALLNLREQAR